MLYKEEFIIKDVFMKLSFQKVKKVRIKFDETEIMKM